MPRVMLIDFESAYVDKLRTDGFDFEIIQATTNWRSDQTESIEPQDCQIVFYSVNPGNLTAASVHLGDSRLFQEIIQSGGVVVCFVGQCKLFHIKNLVGCPDQLQIGNPAATPTDCAVISHAAFDAIFARFSQYIVIANVFDVPFERIERDLDSKLNLAVIAVDNATGLPIALYSKFGHGFYLFLPHFHIHNASVTKLLMEEILPSFHPGLFYDPAFKWLDSPEYYVPKLRELYEQKGKVEEEFSLKIEEINEKIEKVKATEQEQLNKLLKAKGEDLKQATMRVFEYLDFRVIDVDKYWEEQGKERQKEEDLWLFLPGKEIDFQKDFIILAEVKGKDRGAASDDECGAIGKYVRRRSKEFGHQNMKGIFILNHWTKRPGSERGPAFSPTQINDAQRDGDGLLTSFDLFQLIKAEKEGKLTKEEIRNRIVTETGLIEFKQEEVKA